MNLKTGPTVSSTQGADAHQGRTDGTITAFQVQHQSCQLRRHVIFEPVGRQAFIPGYHGSPPRSCYPENPPPLYLVLRGVGGQRGVRTEAWATTPATEHAQGGKAWPPDSPGRSSGERTARPRAVTRTLPVSDAAADDDGEAAW